MRVIFSIIFSGFFLLQLAAQGNKTQLAYQYYNTGEYEKAGQLYEELYNQNTRNTSYFNRYIDCLIALEDYQIAEKKIQQVIKRDSKNISLYTTLGNLYDRQDKKDKAREIYTRAIDNIGNDPNSINRLGSSFRNLRKYDLAIEVYKKGMEITAPKDYYSYNLAGIYRQKGDLKNAIKYYLYNLRSNPKNANSLKTALSKIFEKDGYEEGMDLLKVQLYEEIQEFPDMIVFPELLQWVFEQRKEFSKAFRQAKSLDRRNEENGERVYRLGQNARASKDYDTAIKAFQYIIDTKGQNSSYYFDSKQYQLLAKKNMIVEGYNFTAEDFAPVAIEYDSFLVEFGKNRQTAWLMLDFAELQAEYADNVKSAISILEEIVELKGINRLMRARAKINLADYYLIDEQIWEATLLYSQVDKEFKEEQIGEKARFKNAMFSYYRGNFEWAQEQFDILKAATSRLISNDAIDMSVFIIDNMGLDTTDVPLKMFADADLLFFQNKFDLAFSKLDSINTLFPEHSLLDDILYKKAQIYVKKQDFSYAIAAYNQVIEKHTEEIRCDNSIYELASLYENQLEDRSKAKELYKKLFIDFSNSTLAVEARKKYRFLEALEENVQ